MPQGAYPQSDLFDGAVEINNVKPSHSGNTYPMLFWLILM